MDLNGESAKGLTARCYYDALNKGGKLAGFCRAIGEDFISARKEGVRDLILIGKDLFTLALFRQAIRANMPQEQLNGSQIVLFDTNRNEYYFHKPENYAVRIDQFAAAGYELNGNG